MVAYKDGKSNEAANQNASSTAYAHTNITNPFARCLKLNTHFFCPCPNLLIYRFAIHLTFDRCQRLCLYESRSNER